MNIVYDQKKDVHYIVLTDDEALRLAAVLLVGANTLEAAGEMRGVDLMLEVCIGIAQNRAASMEDEPT